MNEREIFAEALQRPASARADFLVEACAGDAALRRRIESLLREQDELGSFLEKTPPAVALDETRDAGNTVHVGQMIGPYKLLQQIGEGGMGAVYMAEQHEPVQRRVALKIIKAGMDTRQVIARFEAERQALAMMDHPNIAKVLDAGTTTAGHPYFVMELVKGVPITQYCDRQHLPLRERLELFVPVCQAIQHAHQKGIIHRDLKPSNVLVALYDGRPVPKVIDFGVAKATSQRLTEKTMFTEFGQIVGTLEYMSPEQAELSQLDIDTRSDVYSLGVLLYELLTGTTPFEKQRLRTAAFDEILRMIREEEPPRPSTRLSTTEQLPSIAANRSTPPAKLSGLMRGELDWIVMKALEKDRSRRYETANGLARDVERYLHDEPVQACPPSAMYLFRKYLNRHRGLVAGGGIVLAALLLGAIGTTAGLMRAAWERSAKEAANRSAAQSDKLATAATKAEGDAKAALTRAVAAEREVRILAHLNQARWHRTSGLPGQKFDCLAEIEQAVALNPAPALRLQLRNEAIAALALADLQVARTIAGLPLERQAVFDRPLQRYVLADPQGGLVVREAANGSEILRIPPSEPLFRPTSLRFSEDGKLLIATHALGNGSPQSRLIDLTTGEVQARLPGELQWLSGDRRRALLFTSGARNEIAVFELPSGIRQRTIPITPSRIGSRPFARNVLAVSPDGEQLAVESNDQLEIWNLTSGQRVRALPNNRWGAWHPGGELLAACNGLHVEVIESRTQKVLARTEVELPNIIEILFHPQGEVFLTKSSDNSLRLWSTVSGRRLLTLHGAPLWQTEFSPDGDQLGWTTSGGRGEIWRIDLPWDYRRELHAENRTLFSSAQFSADNSLFVATTSSGGSLWHVDSGRQLYVANPATWLDFEPATGDLLTLSKLGLHRWPIRRPGPDALQIGPPQAIREGDDKFTTVAIAADGQRAIGSSFLNGGAALFSLAKSSDSALPLRFFGAANVAISPDGLWAATAPYSQSVRNQPTRIWNAASGAQVHQLPLDLVHGENVPVAFSGDSQWLAVVTEEACRLWRCGTWEPGPIVPRQQAGGSIIPPRLRFSRDGRLLALATSFQSLSLVNSDDGRELASFDLGTPNSQIGLVGLSNDNSRLAVASIDDSIFLWNVARVRMRLRSLGLDWNSEPLPLTPPLAAPHTVSIDRGTYEEDHRAAIAMDQPASTGTAGALPMPPAGATVEQQIAFYTLHVELHPQDAELRKQRARAYSASGNQTSALTDLQAAMRLRPDDSEALYESVLLQLQLGQKAEAKESARKLIALQPDSSSSDALGVSCAELALAYSQGPEASVQSELILDLCARAVELAPRSQWARARVGHAYSRLARWDLAATNLERAAELRGSIAIYVIWRDLAQVELGRRNRQAAQAYLDKIKAWEAANQASLPSAARDSLRRFVLKAHTDMLRRELTLPPQATPQQRLELLSQILANDPADAAAFLARGQIYRQLGNRQSALADIAKALEFEPNYPSALTALAGVQVSMGDLDGAQATARRMMQIDPNEAEPNEIANACGFTAQSLINMRATQTYELVFQLGQKMLAVQPYWGTRVRVGAYWYQIGRWDDAARELELAVPEATLAKMPENAWLYLAMVEFQRRDKAKAQDYLDQTAKWRAKNDAKLTPEMRSGIDSLQQQAEELIRGAAPTEKKK